MSRREASPRPGPVYMVEVRHHSLPLGKVFNAVEHVGTFGLEHRVLGQVDAIGVDRIQFAKSYKYLTLVYQIDLGVTRLLCVGRSPDGCCSNAKRI